MATQDRLPTSNGTYNQWTSGSGGNKWDDVDDPISSPDEDTTYIYATSNGILQYFNFTAFSITSSAITKVSIMSRAKFSGTAVNIRLYLRVSTGDYPASPIGTTTSYVDYTSDWLTNPRSGVDWTEDDVERLGSNPLNQFGVASNALDGGEQLNCTQSYITVTYTAAGGGLSIPIAMYHYQHHIGSGV